MKILHPNCSELLADFNIYDPLEAYNVISALGKRQDWVFEPALSVKLLEKMIRKTKQDPQRNYDDWITIKVLDKNGNATTLEYGPNGYDDELGFRLDSGCNDYDETQYRFFAAALKECNAEIRAFDGGSKSNFEAWLGEELEI